MDEYKVEIKRISDREIWVGKNRHYLDENNILNIKAVGALDENITNEWKNIDLELVDRFGIEENVHVLIDLNDAGKPSSEARSILRELSEQNKNVKTAFFGMHPVARVIASFFIGVSKNKNMKFFKSKEEAVQWLKE